jgi:hypothetical protein
MTLPCSLLNSAVIGTLAAQADLELYPMEVPQ